MNMLGRYISFTAYFFILVSSQYAYATTADDKGDVVVDRQYHIGPGDQLGISVWKEEGMQLDVLVKPDGRITFPLAGDIKAEGMTTLELTDELVRKLEKYIPSPIVTVSMLRTISNKIYVIGKVNRPGEFTATNFMDVLQALTLAGGLTPFADADDIKIIRRTESGEDVFGFDYDEISEGSGLEMNIILKAGDTVVVP